MQSHAVHGEYLQFNAHARLSKLIRVRNDLLAEEI